MVWMFFETDCSPSRILHLAFLGSLSSIHCFSGWIHKAKKSISAFDGDTDSIPIPSSLAGPAPINIDCDDHFDPHHKGFSAH